MPTFDKAQICKNGHVINKYSGTQVSRNEKFCSKCGAETIDSCPKCSTKIKGGSNSGLGGNIYTIPNYCPNCGNAYPWTESKLNALHELTQELEGISTEDRLVLQNNFDELVKDTPRTRIAVERVKSVFQRLAPQAVNLLHDILVDIVSETIRKQLFPN